MREFVDETLRHVLGQLPAQDPLDEALSITATVQVNAPVYEFLEHRARDMGITVHAHVNNILEAFARNKVAEGMQQLNRSDA